MANDPNRDLLPVKEESWRNGKGIYDKFDYQLLGKLSRCELEDRFLRLLDEQTHIKKLANSQEEKIKRLGTKLLRLLNEKKIGKKALSQSKTSEELELRIVELEHENYALKDKNIVLKQQLSSHTRHPPNHRSPLRSNHTSPLMTTRHSVHQPHSEFGYDTTNKSATNEMQLQEAETHINELNQEIKSLHDKIDFLQRNLEKNSLDNRKVKVTENIELIRLQRSLKQQAIQIASLQAQIKSSEGSQKVLKDELVKAHRENDDALQLIAIKQNEILNLCSKLEEKNLNKLEEDELKGRIEDLVRERDCLKKRSDYLMRTIGQRSSEAERGNEIQKALPEEKVKKEKSETLYSRDGSPTQVGKKYTSKNSVLDKGPCVVSMPDTMRTVDSSQQTQFCETKKVSTVFIETSEESGFLCNKCNFCITICKCSQDSVINPEVETESDDQSEYLSDNEKPEKENGESAAEKVKLKRELEYLRGMLKNQTARCEAQQAEIGRLMCELKLNEEKCNETLKRLDFHLRIFQCLEMQERQKGRHIEEPQIVPSLESGRRTTPTVTLQSQGTLTVEECLAQAQDDYGRAPRDGRRDPGSKLVDAKTQTVAPETKEQWTQMEKTPSKEFLLNPISQPSINVLATARDFKIGRPSSKQVMIDERRASFTENTLPQRPILPPKKAATVGDEMPAKFHESAEPKKRFVDQKFLESSDDDTKADENFKRDSFLSKVKNLDEDSGLKQREAKVDDESEESDSQTRSGSYHKKKNKHMVSNTSLKPESKKDSDSQELKISINWFKLELGTPFWNNNEIELLFIDFTFLDMKGEETETPQSLPKPTIPEERCTFNFTKVVPLLGSRKRGLIALIKNPEDEFIVFKVVSDSEKFDEVNGECEDLGMASVTVKEFLQYCNNAPLQVKVENIKNRKEIIGTLSVSFEATPSILNSKK